MTSPTQRADAHATELERLRAKPGVVTAVVSYTDAGSAGVCELCDWRGGRTSHDNAILDAAGHRCGDQRRRSRRGSGAG